MNNENKKKKLKSSYPKQFQELIEKNSNCWWWIKKEDLINMDLGLIVEGMINYADLDEIGKLFDIIGVDKVAEAFYCNAKYPRKLGNYKIEFLNYFNLYFQKHARRNFTSQAKKIDTFIKDFHSGVLFGRGHSSCFAAGA